MIGNRFIELIPEKPTSGQIETGVFTDAPLAAVLNTQPSSDTLKMTTGLLTADLCGCVRRDQTQDEAEVDC